MEKEIKKMFYRWYELHKKAWDLSKEDEEELRKDPESVDDVFESFVSDVSEECEGKIVGDKLVDFILENYYQPEGYYRIRESISFEDGDTLYTVILYGWMEDSNLYTNSLIVKKRISK